MVASSDPVLAEVWRGDYLEALHHGSVAVLSPSGAPRLVLGDVDTPVLARSAVKPVQSVAMLRHGLDVDGALLALSGASHSGEPLHVDGVTALLAGAGLSPADLQTPPALPGDEDALLAWVASGRGKESIAHNCSGKHAGMLRTTVRAGWDPAGYRDPQHPLQRAIAETLAEFTGDEIGAPVTDGCGAPAYPTTLAGLARAFGRLASGADPDALRIADAFRAHPEYASGTRRDEATLHREVPGIVVKSGAEGTIAAGLPDGTGIAIKASDGAHRAVVPALIAVLEALGLGTPTLASFQPQPVLGHGQVVGRVSPSASLRAAARNLAS
ncbi:MAG: asparaginase [Arachnia sp.]